MKAAILVEQKKPLVIGEINIPTELEYGQVLVQVYYSGICGSQLGEISGVKGPDKFLPHLLGHEGSGRVVKVGPGVKQVQAEDHVVLHWRKGIGLDSSPPTYQWGSKKVNAGFVTTFNELAVVSENRITPIPKDFDLKLAPLFGCAVTTGLGVVVNNAELKIGESIVVIGAGGIGLNIIQGASMHSAYPIIAVDLFDDKLELAIKMGATHIINSKKQNIQDEINKIMNGTSLDVVVDNTGQPDIIELAYEMIHSQGKVILVGVPQKGKNISIYSLPLHFGKKLTGSHGGESNPHIDIPRYIRLYQAGKLQLSELITDYFSLSEINVALDKMRSGEISGRCLIEISSP
jgi:S-(hydroxymethyl)glutathione dehydrogenase / alcohol dehydrogenase